MHNPSQPSNDVFISYRRAASEDLAYALYVGLKNRQIDPFFDYESIPAGRWLETILRQIAARPYFVLVLAQGTLERCKNSEDILLREIQEAVALARVIVPVMTPQFDRAELTRYLPKNLADTINAYQTFEMPTSRTYYEVAIDKLRGWLPPIPLPVTPAPLSDEMLLRENQAKVESLPSVQPVQPPSAVHVPFVQFNAPISAQPLLRENQATGESVPQVQVVQTIGKDSKGVEQVYVPAGQFMMGSDPARDHNAQSNEQPAHLVRITRPFWLDRYPVTNAAYKAFIDAGGYGNRALWTSEGWTWRNKHTANGAPQKSFGFGKHDQPRVGVCWYEANAYATWRGGRLPTEAEWEYAARGEKALIYPWGNEYDPARLNAENRIGKATPVNRYPNGVSWCGAYDLAGNVWEWIADWYDELYHQQKVQDDPTGPANGSSRVIRGGLWNFNLIFTRAASRRSLDPDKRANCFGFRVVAGADPVV